tara:strand:- start:897 stop:2120 length:1224 start_codon:yes stop_codon:yes gene_type:complete
MNRCSVKYLVLFIALYPVAFWAFNVEVGPLVTNFASLYFPETVTPEELQQKYDRGPLNVLIVPGHDNSSWGAEFRGLKETELNVVLGAYLFNLFLDDPKFNASLLRGPDGEYMRWFKDYMEVNREEVITFRDASRARVRDAKEDGRFRTAPEIIEHNLARDDVSINLYGINKYANDFGVDIVLHLHFNDYPGRPWHLPGKYSGFSIYVPEEELPNSRASTELAHIVKDQLEAFTNPSNFEREEDIIIPTQELIAVGSNASRDRISMLIEYDYIYESRYQTPELRNASLKELALLTYQGVKNYYDDENMNNTTLLPYVWENDLDKKDKGLDVLALQTALKEKGLYPPEGDTLETCPVSGYYGGCTVRAVKEFQERYFDEILTPLELTQGTGRFGGQTRAVLNTLYDTE